MNLELFIEQRPFLYHLTCKTNANNIIQQRQLFSANQLISLSNDESNQKVKREKRFEHFALIIDGKEVFLRDQQPISEKALGKCLTDNWSIGDFLNHLNDRVFMWPTTDRLWRHFKRYAQEEPVIFRFPTSSILEANPHAQFCRLNSGATRANPYLGGKAPSRGSNTFLSAANFNLPIRDVAEVTFEGQCIISGRFSYSNQPDGQFHEVIQ